LLEALDYAQQTSGDLWEFAVEIQSLHESGLSYNDLRLLVRKNWVEHAREVTVIGQNGRQFQPTGDLTFRRRSCFVLTAEGVVAARKAAGPRAAVEPVSEGNGCARDSHACPCDAPQWDAEKRVLSWSGCVVKRFKWHALNQERVLAAFEEERWPGRIDDPLPPEPEQDPKRRLSDTIKCLNRKQIHELLHFRGDGTGEGVIWEYIGADAPNGKPALLPSAPLP
jgi:hypothetical protein